jgi:hypothetical protein
MTVPIPKELEKALLQRAQQRRMTTKEVVREALVWYLSLDMATIDELSAWQEVRDEALRLVEESPS